MRTPDRLTFSVSAALAALVVAGCGTDATGDQVTGGPGTGGAGTPVAGEAPPATDAATTGRGTVTIDDAQGRAVEVPRAPETVVVMDWSTIRTLSDFDIEVDGAPQAVGSLPDDLASVSESASSAGTLFEPDYEAISALDPDLIIVGSRSGTPEVVAEMERITPAVIDMSVRYEDAQDQIPQFVERVEQLSTIFGFEDAASERLDAILAEIDETADAAEASDLSTMFVQVSGGTVSAYGPGSRFGIVFDDLGFTPTDAPVDDEGSHGQEISQEFFARYDPGAVFVLDRSKTIGEEATPAAEVLANGLVDTTEAATNDRIVEVDGFSWYIATYSPTSFEQIIADVRSVL
ncbi:siderophore ABC transporter substrate-binding protein [Ilumatobacter sp.]|uniref:siderophore ABC transporter substrate-binding protein n=1 Tax=Ilumatobacter sp. TaxID=1967498 RepID=UPI003B52D9A7